MTLGLASGVVELSPPDVTWKAALLTERGRILLALRDLEVAVEHVGSTAVPGLVVKPILDLIAGRPPGGDLRPYVAALIAAGYEYRGEHGLPGREYFVRNAEGGRRTHHVHLVKLHGEFWRAHLAFRDYLCRVPARAAAYAALKQTLAGQYPRDRAAYTDGKAAFIAETLRLAAAAQDAWRVVASHEGVRLALRQPRSCPRLRR